MKTMHPDVFRELFALNYAEGDYVQTLRTFVDSGVDTEPNAASRKTLPAPKKSLALPLVRHRGQQELLVAFGALKQPTHQSVSNFVT
jgi:hypothetical protein